MIHKILILTLEPYLAYLFFVLIGWVIERKVNSVEVNRLNPIRLNLECGLLYELTAAITLTVAPAFTTVGVNAAGGGWIVLPSSGWTLFPAFLLYAFTMDFFEYLFHRAQHRIPILWSMHSLHHSDAAINASTTNRHYWAEFAIKSMTIYMMGGIIFKVSSTIIGFYVVLGFYNFFPHMNLRVGLGRWWMVLNSPQYHRIHHSSLREHWNCNFSGLFPIFDVIFGTFHIPKQGEYPPTGLDTGEHPSGLIEAAFWPVRSLWRGAKVIDGLKVE
ncbi:sterol desaturase family protein [Paraburkholderia mimosarum]|uniref:sterol desaturase family protein n=1 Tax=Paraburkholderia mimosarum TaxID=312026 RepID=UPI0039C06CD4